jgi:aerobic carbon-monoxide dehydrogenase large subunit
VEVDVDTGHTDIVAYTAVDDFGQLINPMIVEGQVQGGVAQGIGQALTEGVVYDEDSGQLLTGSYMDYHMPRARDLPHIENFKLGFTHTPALSNPLGLKGCGEAGAIAATPAVINAITHAIGVRDLAMPATPLTVWTAMQAMKKAAE